jgi:hypothetical protein
MAALSMAKDNIEGGNARGGALRKARGNERFFRS